jgi:hypothetical protein
LRMDVVERAPSLEAATKQRIGEDIADSGDLECAVL